MNQTNFEEGPFRDETKKINAEKCQSWFHV